MSRQWKRLEMDYTTRVTDRTDYRCAPASYEALPEERTNGPRHALSIIKLIWQRLMARKSVPSERDETSRYHTQLVDNWEKIILNRDELHKIYAPPVRYERE